MSLPSGEIWYQTFSRDGRKPTIDELVRLVMARPRMPRLLAKPIPDNLPIYLCEAVRWIPYRTGEVPIHAIIVRDADLRELLAEASGLGEAVSQAPVWLVIAAEWRVPWWKRYADPWREWSLRELASDVGMAVLMMMLAAETAEVCAIPCWQFPPRRIRKALLIPRQYPLFCLLALGYAEPTNEPATLPRLVTLFSHAELW